MSKVVTWESETTVPADVAEFCASRGLAAHLQTALRLAEAHFDHVREIQIELETDPETDEQTVVETVAVMTTVDEVVRRKTAYTRAWVESVPPDVADRIRLLFDIR